MPSFKDLFVSGHAHHPLEGASTQVTLSETGQTLFLRFNSQDVILNASYTGKIDPWLSSLCFMLEEKTLDEAHHFNHKTWEETFKNDQTFWDLRVEHQQDVYFYGLELLRAAIDKYRGREEIYTETSPLICRCFNVREDDVLSYLRREKNPTVAGLSAELKAGMGCRSCVPQLKRWLEGHASSQREHFFKEKPKADWILEFDYLLSCFPESIEWKMEVESFKGNQIVISYDKDVPQAEAEEVGQRLQLFLGAATDSSLGFFLIRARSRQRFKASE